MVSGMAFGIDGRAHRSALRGPGRTIAVLAGGADVPYPARHTELWHRIAAQGLIVSESAPGTSIHTKAFPRRNRIVSGLSLGVVVVEASSEKSGSLITARLASEQGRTVYVPAPEALHGPYAEGTKKLLMSGAFPVWRAGDILADLFPHLCDALKEMTTSAEPPCGGAEDLSPASEKRETAASGISGTAIQVSEPAASCAAPGPSEFSSAAACRSAPSSSDDDTLLALLGRAPLSPDELLMAVQELDVAWTAPRLLSTLMILEVKRKVRRLSDSRYEVCS